MVHQLCTIIRPSCPNYTLLVWPAGYIFMDDAAQLIDRHVCLARTQLDSNNSIRRF